MILTSFLFFRIIRKRRAAYLDKIDDKRAI